jgi:hypothetical protein
MKQRHYDCQDQNSRRSHDARMSSQLVSVVQSFADASPNLRLSLTTLRVADILDCATTPDEP